MYIDDGALFACTDNWEEVAESLSTNYFICIDWLMRVGMAVEPDKTELLFFRKQREKVEPPSSIHLCIPTISSYYQVKASTTICYLSFYIDHRLRWSRHVDIMCNRARASIKALQILGNSVHGISFAQWRLVFNAVCLPVLTYGCQLWYTRK